MLAVRILCMLVTGPCVCEEGGQGGRGGLPSCPGLPPAAPPAREERGPNASHPPAAFAARRQRPILALRTGKASQLSPFSLHNPSALPAVRTQQQQPPGWGGPSTLLAAPLIL